MTFYNINKMTFNATPVNKILNPSPTKAYKACGECNEVHDHMKKCDSCKCIYYCSRECQVKDWKQHKKFCGMIDSSNARKLAKFLKSFIKTELFSKLKELVCEDEKVQVRFEFDDDGKNKGSDILTNLSNNPYPKCILFKYKDEITRTTFANYP